MARSLAKVNAHIWLGRGASAIGPRLVYARASCRYAAGRADLHEAQTRLLLRSAAVLLITQLYCRVRVPLMNPVIRGKTSEHYTAAGGTFAAHRMIGWTNYTSKNTNDEYTNV